MDKYEARILIFNFLDRIPLDPQLEHAVTQRELDALHLLLEISPLGPMPSESQSLTSASVDVGVDGDAQIPIQDEPYTGTMHLCLDFGTAMSKAFAWDRESDTPIPLKIGDTAGQGDATYALDSTIFISTDGQMFFGQRARQQAAAVNPEDLEDHQAFQSIKELLAVGPMVDLQCTYIEKRYNPSGEKISRAEIITLYLAFLTDNALLSLQEYSEYSRRVPCSYTKPVFDKRRDDWATQILGRCAANAHILADRFSGRWSDGIPVNEIKTLFLDMQEQEIQKHLVLDANILPEPVAAFASRVWNYIPSDISQDMCRRLIMVIDVGAGTTDFAMFAEVENDSGIKLWPIKNSVTTIRIAGDLIDNALIDFLLCSVGIQGTHPQIGDIRADLRNDIRLLKERLFEHGTVERTLVNDLRVEVTLDRFMRCEDIKRFKSEIGNKFEQVLSEIHESWLNITQFEVYFTGGGAALPMVTALGTGQPILIQNRMITPNGVTTLPQWIQEDSEFFEKISDVYPQLAVCIGGACHGAGKTHSLNLENERVVFGGGLQDVLWELETVQKGI